MVEPVSMTALTWIASSVGSGMTSEAGKRAFELLGGLAARVTGRQVPAPTADAEWQALSRVLHEAARRDPAHARSLATVLDLLATARPGTRARYEPPPLPPGVRSFTDRKDALRLLTREASRAAAGRPRRALVYGSEGIGTSALAVHWAREHAADFPDRALRADLRGEAPGHGRDPALVLRTLLHGLGLADEDLPPSLDARAETFRRLTEDRRMVVILDHAQSAAQLQPLLTGAPGVFTIVAARRLLPGVDAALVPVRPLTDRDATRLLKAVAGKAAVAGARDRLPALLGRCAGSPYALHAAARDLLGADREPQPGTVGSLDRHAPASVTGTAPARRRPRGLTDEPSHDERPSDEPPPHRTPDDNAAPDPASHTGTEPPAQEEPMPQDPQYPEDRESPQDRENPENPENPEDPQYPEDRESPQEREDPEEREFSHNPEDPVRAAARDVYDRLPEDTARCYRLWALRPWDPLRPPAAAAIAGISEAVAARLLADLADRSLLEHAADGGYRYREGVRRHAEAAALQADGLAACSRAVRRGVAHHLDVAVHAARAALPERWAVGQRYAAAGAGRYESRAAALAVLVADLGNLLAAGRAAEEFEDFGAVVELAEASWPAQLKAGRHDEVLPLLRIAARVARDRFPGTRMSGRVHAQLGLALTEQGGYDRAEDALRQAAADEQDAGHVRGQATAVESLGLLRLRQWRWREADECFEAAGALWDRVGPADDGFADLPRARALLHRHRGRALRGLDDIAASLDRSQTALAAFRDIGDVYNAARTLTDLAETHLKAGAPGQALPLADEALAVLVREGADAHVRYLRALRARCRRDVTEEG